MTRPCSRDSLLLLNKQLVYPGLYCPLIASEMDCKLLDWNSIRIHTHEFIVIITGPRLQIIGIKRSCRIKGNSPGLQEVQQNYVDTIDMKSMTDAAVSAALAQLDPHSVYLPPVELTESETELSGNFEGIGITFNVPNDTAIVLSAIPGGPSEKAGLMQGDRIVKVDETVIAGKKTPQDSMIRLMKGPAGTKVKITVSRDGTEIPFDIIRDKIPVHSVDAAFMIDETTGYIKLSKFTRTTYKEFCEASEKLLGMGMKRLIFDLRDNTGGYVDQ